MTILYKTFLYLFKIQDDRTKGQSSNEGRGG
jgi:hypothetical protein